MRLYIKSLFLSLVTSGLLIGCLNDTDRLMIQKQDEIALDAIKRMPILKQFGKHFPNESHFISYVTGKQGPTMWNNKVGVFDRYVIEMKIPAYIDRRTLALSLTGEPTIRVREITRISSLPDGRLVIDGGGGFDVSSSIWRDFLSGKLSLDQLGIPFEKDRPVPGFKKDVTDF